MKNATGKIANPTVHIGLNQLRQIVNALIKRYGHPSVGHRRGHPGAEALAQTSKMK